VNALQKQNSHLGLIDHHVPFPVVRHRRAAVPYRLSRLCRLRSASYTDSDGRSDRPPPFFLDRSPRRASRPAAAPRRRAPRTLDEIDFGLFQQVSGT
jgi:hypothetical protein